MQFLGSDLTNTAGTSAFTVGGGGGGSGNSVAAEVDFGFASGNEGDVARVTIAAAWVTNTTKLVCSGNAIATADHDPDDYIAEGVQFYTTNIVNGVGFDVIAMAPRGTWGRYSVNVIGI